MEPREAYDDLVDAWLTKPGVTVGPALQNEVLKVENKIFAFLKDDELVVKLPAAVVQDLLSTGRATAFTSGGRTMREWATLPWTDAAAWQAWMAQAYDYVGGLARSQKSAT